MSHRRLIRHVLSIPWEFRCYPRLIGTRCTYVGLCIFIRLEWKGKRGLLIWLKAEVEDARLLGLNWGEAEIICTSVAYVAS